MGSGGSGQIHGFWAAPNPPSRPSYKHCSIFSGDHLSLCMYSLWDGESLELPFGEGHRVLGGPFSSTSGKDRGRRL